MKLKTLLFIIFVFALLAGCTINKEAREEANPSEDSTESSSQQAEEYQVETIDYPDDADSISVNTSIDGEKIVISTNNENRTVDCDNCKLVVHGRNNELLVRGVVQKMVVNGDNNEIKTVAFVKTVVNGDNNDIFYEKLTNGKRPDFVDNGDNNTLTRIKNGEPVSDNTTVTRQSDRDEDVQISGDNDTREVRVNRDGKTSTVEARDGRDRVTVKPGKVEAQSGRDKVTVKPGKIEATDSSGRKVTVTRSGRKVTINP